jgi:signal recognition particle receptor subunit beta
MVLFNYATKEITAKIVYYGPGLCGKTTNLQFVYDSLPSNNKSKMLSLATKTDRTLFFDFLPLDLGKIRGMRTKLQLYTVPGQVYYNSTRQLVLKGADGIVFVADSQDHALDANVESLQNLEDNLKRQGVRIRDIPVVIQYNKRDLPNALPVAQLDKEINKLQVPHYESVATTGLGVEEALKGITQLVLVHLIRKYNLQGSEPLEREIQILNPTLPREPAPAESLWDESGEIVSASGPISAPNEAFVIDEAATDDNLPLVPTELIGGADAVQEASPFEEVTDYFSTPSAPPQANPPANPQAPAHKEATTTAIPLTSIEMALPDNILESLPKLDQRLSSTASAVASPPTQPQTERRAGDGLVKEVTIPLNLSLEEIKLHRRLRLKITLDVNLLP